MWDLYSTGSSNNTFINFTTNDTSSSFTLDGGIALRNANGTNRPDLSGYKNLSHYLNITNVSADSWIYINVSYKDSDVSSDIVNSTIKIWRNSSGTWSSSIGSPNTINQADKYVYANITDYRSTFAPMGEMLGIDSCRNLTQANTVYNLTTNLTGNQSSGRCIDIQADNVTLDCAGHNITGNVPFLSNAVGIYLSKLTVSNITNVTVKNCIISGYLYGISGLYADLDYFINNTIFNSTNGIDLHNAFYNIAVINNNIYDISIGVEFGTVGRNITVFNNTIYNAAALGISADNDEGRNNITLNRISNVSNYGISSTLSTAKNNSIWSNTITNCTAGIYITVPGEAYEQIINNIVNDNQYGIYLYTISWSWYNNISMNIANNNDYGIYVSNGENRSNLINNTAKNNQYGFYIEGSDNNLTNNIADNNSLWDVYLLSTGTGLRIVNMTVGNTLASFDKGMSPTNLYIKAANGTGRPDPTGYSNISHYLNLSGPIGSQWVYVNISYKDSDIPSSIIDNSTIKIWKNSSGQWWDGTYVGATNGIDATNKIVYANITNFSSIYAPMGETPEVGSCRNLTGANTVYTLTSNIAGNQSNGICIDVQANNVTLDCARFRIDGTYPVNYTDYNTYGIVAYNWSSNKGYNNTTIRNCTVSNYAYGTFLKWANNVNLTDNIAQLNAEGIAISGNTSSLTNNNVSNNFVGIDISGLNNSLTNNSASAASNSGTGFQLSGANNSFTNNNAFNNSIGIVFASLYNSNLTNNIVHNNTEGVYFMVSSNNSFTNNNVSNNVNGIILIDANNTAFINNTASNNTEGDFLSGTQTSGSINNIIINLTTNDTTSSFTYYGNISLSSAVGINSHDPAGYTNLSHYLNITNQSAGSAWVYINISYKDSDIPSSIIDNSTIKIWKNSSGQWWSGTYVGSPNGINQAGKYVYANITNFSSVYAPMGQTSQPLNVTVLINGVKTTAFGNAGEPYNVTVIVKENSTGNPVSNAVVRTIEINGYTPFTQPQYDISNVSNYVYGETNTSSSGIVMLTAVPTGGRYVLNSQVGSYNITVNVTKPGYDDWTGNFTLINRTSFTAPSATISIPNKNNIEAFNLEVYRIYAIAKGWLVLGGGVNYSVTVYTNGTAVGMPAQLISGKPTGFNITVVNHTSLVPITNARVEADERNGYPPFVLPQHSDTNISNHAVGETRTGGTGTTQFTLIPTGGRYIQSGVIGAYNATIRVYNNDSSLVYTATIPVNDSLPLPAAPAYGIYNSNNIESFNLELYRLYTSVKGWLTY
jgi:parallel beta-helix repeat protein